MSVCDMSTFQPFADARINTSVLSSSLTDPVRAKAIIRDRSSQAKLQVLVCGRSIGPMIGPSARDSVALRRSSASATSAFSRRTFWAILALLRSSHREKAPLVASQRADHPQLGFLRKPWGQVLCMLRFVVVADVFCLLRPWKHRGS